MIRELINDRLLLGMKGTFSELELSILRQRSQEALRLKAARGDLHTTIAIGYVRSTDDRLELDSDRRVRAALSWCSASSQRSVASDKSPCGCVMRASRCRWSCMARKAE